MLIDVRPSRIEEQLKKRLKSIDIQLFAFATYQLHLKPTSQMFNFFQT